MVKITKEAALEYHQNGRPGKIEVIPTKSYSTQTDLSLAYSPGVAYPCLEIQENPDNAYKYTDKGNLVAVITNGTAVLGLGNIGAMSGKPVMEGKGLLFKIYGGIDVFDIEIDETDPDKFCEAVEKIAPTFGGINLEDIKAPECFAIEERLKRTLDIPVMHDDQHGTAIISAAGLKNALEVAGKDIEKVRLVVNGAGAAAISCTKLYTDVGLSRRHYNRPSEPHRAKETLRNRPQGRAHIGGSDEGCRRFRRTIKGQHSLERDDSVDERQPYRVRIGKSSTRNIVRRRNGSTPRRAYGYWSLGLSEPD